MNYPLSTFNRYQVWAVMALLIFMLLCLILFTRWREKVLSIAPYAILLLVVAESYIVNRNFLFSLPQNFDHPTIQKSLDFLKSRDKSDYYITYYKFPQYDFAESVSNSNQIRLLNAYYGYGLNDYNLYDSRAKYIIKANEEVVLKNEELIFENREHKILFNKDYLPFVSFINKSGQQDEALVKLTSSKLDGYSFELNNLKESGYLRILINYFPGWQFRINNAGWHNFSPGDELRVSLSRNDRRVDLRFLPRAFYLGLGISLLVWISLFILEIRVKLFNKLNKRYEVSRSR